MTTILTEDRTSAVPHADASGDDLWIPKADVPRAIGWTLKPEGLCKDDVCVPLPRGREAQYVREDAVNVAAFWRLMGRTVFHDAARETWFLGASARERADALQSLVAPDFTLPDLEGKLHTLSDYRGKRVFLTTWASW